MNTDQAIKSDGHGSGQIFPGFDYASKSMFIRVIRGLLP